eukprot:SAG22_NODE_15432_length_349_cov_0.616000_1_plen_62_part_10
MHKPKVVVLIFVSGKLVITGAKDRGNIYGERVGLPQLGKATSAFHRARNLCSFLSLALSLSL